MDSDMRKLRTGLRETEVKPKDWPDETLPDQEPAPVEAEPEPEEVAPCSAQAEEGQEPEPEPEPEGQAEAEAEEQAEEAEVPAQDEPTEEAPAPTGPPRLSQEDTAAAFALFDADARGTLQGVDLECALLGVGVDPAAAGIDESTAVDLDGFAALIATHATPANSHAEITHVFSAFDRSATGELTALDIYETVSGFDPRVTEAEVAEVVRYVAAEGRDVVTLDDFVRATRALEGLPLRVQQKYGVVDPRA